MQLPAGGCRLAHATTSACTVKQYAFEPPPGKGRLACSIPLRTHTNANATNANARARKHAQIATPELQLVLDPLLYLKAAEAAGRLSNGSMPKLIHMTMRSKHKVQAHQVGSWWLADLS